MSGVEHADSFNLNPHKWLLVGFDCAAVWFRDAPPGGAALRVGSAMLEDGENLKADAAGLSGLAVPDYRHWQIPFGRRCVCLKWSIGHRIMH